MTIALYAGCKLCNLIDREPDLWWEVHRRVLADASPYGNVMTWLNAQIEARNQRLKPEHRIVRFNRMNFHNHFVKFKHVTTIEGAREICSDGFAMHAKGKKGRRQVPDLRLPPVMNSEDELAIFMTGATDFQRMKALIAASEARLHAFNNQMTRREIAEGDEYVVVLQDVALFQKLVTELLKLQKEALKVEVSSKVAGAALKDAVGLLVESTMDKVESIAVEIHGILMREMPGSRLPDQVSTLLRSGIGSTMKEAIPQVLETIQQRYGIR